MLGVQKENVLSKTEKETCVTKNDVVIYKKLLESSVKNIFLGEIRTDYGSNMVYLLQGNDGLLHLVFIRKCAYYM